MPTTQVDETELKLLRELYEAVVTVAMWDKSIQQGAISKYVGAKDYMFHKAREIYQWNADSQAERKDFA